MIKTQNAVGGRILCTLGSNLTSLSLATSRGNPVNRELGRYVLWVVGGSGVSQTWPNLSWAESSPNPPGNSRPSPGSLG